MPTSNQIAEKPERMSLPSWIATLDLSKAIVLAIVAVIASWYDLRSQVGSAVITQEATKQEILLKMDALKQEATLRWAGQAGVDNAQNDSIKGIHDEVKDGFKDIKQAIRDQNEAARARR